MSCCHMDRFNRWCRTSLRLRLVLLRLLRLVLLVLLVLVALVLLVLLQQQLLGVVLMLRLRHGDTAPPRTPENPPPLSHIPGLRVTRSVELCYAASQWATSHRGAVLAASWCRSRSRAASCGAPWPTHRCSTGPVRR